MLEILQLYHQHSKEQIIGQLSAIYPLNVVDEGYAIIDDLVQAYGLFTPGTLQSRLSPVSQVDSTQMLNQGIQGICLEVTESCNLRCRYCAFSGGYVGNRVHTSRHMSWEVARAAIDFFHKKSKDKIEERPGIGFYGGEPLICFDLIKSCVEYTNSRPWAHPEGVHWSITTNGTLLSEESMRFFVDHAFGVTISVDGPAAEHDRNRVYASGEGTFHRVIENVQRFYELAPKEYYESHVIANCVFAPDTDLLALDKFFVEHRHLFPHVMSGSVSKGHKTFFKEHPLDVERRHQQLDSLFHTYVDAHLQPELVSPDMPELVFIRSLFEKDFLTIRRRHIEGRVPDRVDVSPACFPGKRKPFVDVEGNLHICERVDRTYPIGDVRSGFDVERVTALVNEYAALMNAEDCLNCWAFRFCDLCYAPLLKDGGLSSERKRAECARIRDNAAFKLTTYCHILEQNPKAFGYMDSYVIK